jgi:hypothetical protein
MLLVDLPHLLKKKEKEKEKMIMFPKKRDYIFEKEKLC